MRLTRATPTGLEYLEAVTRLAQRIRLEDRFAGLYEAADLQWWWREDDAAWPDRQLFWNEAAGSPVACCLFLDDERQWNCDLLWVPSRLDVVRAQVWPEILDRLVKLDRSSVVTLREDEVELRSALLGLGYREGAAVAMQTVLERDPTVGELSPSFSLESRAQAGSRPHPMIARNGAEIERKLGECSLYRADLDLAAYEQSGKVAAYALFWMDPTTRVGLVEPMRSEEEFQGRGLAAHLLAEGIHRLRALGAETIKVSYRVGNEPARRLYHGAGFRDLFRKMEYQKGERPDSTSASTQASF